MNSRKHAGGAGEGAVVNAGDVVVDDDSAYEGNAKTFKKNKPLTIFEMTWDSTSRTHF